MIEDTLNKIYEIEAKAEELLKHARQNAALSIKKANEEFEQESLSLRAKLQKEEASLLAEAGRKALAESEEITTQANKAIAEIKNKAEAQKGAAYKEIIKCLGN
jgi:vacuolar-type H+-ATPase subunit H